MRLRTAGCAVGGIALFVFAGSVQSFGQFPTDVGVSTRRATGQGVAPVFEGWEPNPDGTFRLYFGYFNRNWEEEVDILIGPNNFFEPAPQDHGQPTHFLVNRHKRNFFVVVPKDFGTKTLTWTLVRGGRKDRITGALEPVYQIDTTKHEENGAPTVDAGPDQTVVFPQPATLIATARDDGLPSRGPGGSRLAVHWRKYRGDGKVTFDNVMPPVKDGKAMTTVTFNQPGVYVIQALVDDGSGGSSPGREIPGFMCCWATDQVTVTVKTASGSADR